MQKWKEALKTQPEERCKQIHSGFTGLKGDNINRRLLQGNTLPYTDEEAQTSKD